MPQIPDLPAATALTADDLLYVEDGATSKKITAATARGFLGVVISSADYASIQAAVDAAQTAGGGTVVVPPGTYAETLAITDPAPVQVLAFGATLQASANDQTLLQMAAGNSTGSQRCRVAGFDLDGNGFTGVVGVEYLDGDGAVASDLHIEDCAVGVRWRTEGDGAWVERCFLHDSFIRTCAVGVEYLIDGVSAMPSFNETAMTNVGITDCTLGIAQRQGCDFTRTTWKNVTIWVRENETGVLFDGRLDFSRLEFGIESLEVGGATAVGIEVGANYESYADVISHDLRISMVGDFADRVIDNSAIGGIHFADGAHHWISDFAGTFTVQKTSESFARLKMDAAGFKLGPGDAEPPIHITPWYSEYVQLQGNWLFQDDPGFPTAAANGGSATKAMHIWGTADSRAGYVPVYATADGPALVPNNVQTGDYTLVASDAGKCVEIDSASGETVTVPPNSSVAFTVGTTVQVCRIGSGAVTLAPGSGVVLSSAGSLLDIAAQNGVVNLRKRDTDQWVVWGDLG